MSTGDLGQEPNGHQSGVSVTAGAALARLAELERERRVGDALVQVAEQAGETLDLKSVLDRICRLTVELVPADRTTIYVSSKRVRAYVPIADHGTPAHVKQRMMETYYYGAKQAGAMRPMFVEREAMAAAGIVTWTRDDAPTPAALELLEEAEEYALCLVSLGPVGGSIAVGLHQPPGFDETAIRIIEGIARQAGRLVQHARLLDKTQRAARARAGIAALAAAANLETDSLRIARLVASEAASLFRVDAAAMLLKDGDGLRVIGADGIAAEGLHLSLDDETALLFVTAFRDGTTVFQNDLADGPMGGSPLCRDFGLKSCLVLPLVGSQGVMGCFLLGHTERRHAFSQEIADEVVVLGPIASAAVERAGLFQALAEARDEALTTARLKSEFLANMSHEIRTPMNGVIGMAELLVETELTDEQRDFTNVIRASGEALLTVINDILDFSKIDAGKMTIEHVAFNLRTVLEEVAEMLALRAVQKQLELICVIPPALPEHLVGDPHRLRQVMINLIGNAIKFTETGSVSTDAQLLEESATHARLRLTVRDTGIGVPKDRQAMIFDSFTQADGSTTRRYGGTGLGLSICRRLVELMGGTIGLESEPGRGSAFWVEMRFEKQPASETAQRPAKPDLADLRVLVVDDHEVNRRILCEQLRSAGCRTEAAASGAQALAMLQATAGNPPFDVAILDMQMPELDGEATAGLIKAIPRLAGVPLILLSSMGTRGTADDMRAKGFAATVTKPVRQAQLVDVVSRVANEVRGEVRRPEARAAEGVGRLGLRVLLAEDNAVNQKVALRILERLGCQAHAVGDGREAVAALERGTYDLVLMDVQMPEMDGFEATAQIRRCEERTGRHVPVIAMTAHAMEGDQQRCLASGMDGYLAKPVKPDDVARALRRYCKTA